eukprot:SAG31_NODE_2681_length_5262_cov_5.705791_2_plen_187_part_00
MDLFCPSTQMTRSESRSQFGCGGATLPISKRLNPRGTTFTRPGSALALVVAAGALATTQPQEPGAGRGTGIRDEKMKSLPSKKSGCTTSTSTQQEHPYWELVASGPSCSNSISRRCACGVNGGGNGDGAVKRDPCDICMRRLSSRRSCWANDAITDVRRSGCGRAAVRQPDSPRSSAHFRSCHRQR